MTTTNHPHETYSYVNEDGRVIVARIPVEAHETVTIAVPGETYRRVLYP